METYYKTILAPTEAEATALLDAADDYIANPAPGKEFPELDAELIKIWNDGARLNWEFSAETLQEYNQRIAAEQAEADQLAFYQNPINIEAWKDAKIRPWRDSMLSEWIDKPRQLDLLYNFENWTQEQKDERVAKRQELLDWPALSVFDAWISDADIEAAKPSAPSWAT